MNTQYKKGVLELVVLSKLKKNDMYGYQLVSEISESIEISEGTIYPLLRRLCKEEYLDSYLEESTQGPPRKYYKITDKGRENLEEQLEEWKKFLDQLREILEEE